MAPSPRAEISIRILKAILRPMTPISAAPTPARIPLYIAVKLFGPGPNEISSKILLDNYLKILTILSPVAPHFSSECIDELKMKIDPNWPTVDKNVIQKKVSNIVIQINGKKRGIIACDINTDESKILEIIKLQKQYEIYIKDKTIKKTIYVKDRLINLIIE